MCIKYVPGIELTQRWKRNHQRNHHKAGRQSSSPSNRRLVSITHLLIVTATTGPGLTCKKTSRHNGNTMFAVTMDLWPHSLDWREPLFAIHRFTSPLRPHACNVYQPTKDGELFVSLLCLAMVGFFRGERNETKQIRY